MEHFTISDLASMPRFFRANFINSLSGFKSLHLLGSFHEDGTPNLGLFSNIVHLGADPALLGIVNRPQKAAPHSIANIEREKVFTLNAVHEKMLVQAHQCSAKYDIGHSEFEAVGLNSELKTTINAPFVKESKIKYACTLKEILPIKHNGTFFIIAEITDVFIEKNEWIKADGFIQQEKAGTITSLGIDAYYETSPLARLTYAKVDKWPEKID